MRVVFAAVLLFGLGIAGFAVYMAQNYIKEIDRQAALAKENAPPSIDLVDGFIVARQMKFGEKLALKDVRRTKWPKAAMPEGMFTDADELFPDGDNRQRVVLRTMEQGEVLIAAKLTDPGQEAGIRSRLKEGERAFTIKVDVTSGVSGLLRPGDRVDVYWTGRVENDRSGRGDFTKLIQPNVKLIAVDQSVNEEMEGRGIARTVTVAVTSEEVPALNFAQSSGRLSLSLVGAGDDTIAEVIEVDQKRLLGIEDAPAPEVREVVQVEPERVCSIKTRRGGAVTTIDIPCTN